MAANKQLRRPGMDQAVSRIGCVSYLNAKPLIDGLIVDKTGKSGPLPRPQIQYAVPSALLSLLESGSVDLALCSVIDYYRSSIPLQIIPVGGIGSDGETLTVRLFSRIPLDQITQVYADCDSHTSIALLRILMRHLYHRDLQIIRLQTLEATARYTNSDWPDVTLLIGDKVMNRAPPDSQFLYQLDLGAAWKKWTGRPFVFAIWMSRCGAELGDIPELLQQQRERNTKRIDSIAQRHATTHGWPIELAQRYLCQIMKYETGPTELEAIEHFARHVAELGLIAGVDQPSPLRIWTPPDQ